ncbi:hypothetical protein DRJ17_01930 [Candidatus Woesearchaeota archaeon]|nr:MAG: hypothetical protein DRJ17_01930 [Candidatus Woesearchaeota archaeon]
MRKIILTIVMLSLLPLVYAECTTKFFIHDLSHGEIIDLSSFGFDPGCEIHAIAYAPDYVTHGSNCYSQAFYLEKLSNTRYKMIFTNLGCITCSNLGNPAKIFAVQVGPGIKVASGQGSHGEKISFPGFEEDMPTAVIVEPTGHTNQEKAANYHVCVATLLNKNTEAKFTCLVNGNPTGFSYLAIQSDGSYGIVQNNQGPGRVLFSDIRINANAPKHIITESYNWISGAGHIHNYNYYSEDSEGFDFYSYWLRDYKVVWAGTWTVISEAPLEPIDTVISCDECPDGYTAVMSISSLSNAHAALDPDYYDCKVCVPPGVSKDNCNVNSDNIAIRLSDVSNAHAELPSEDNYDNVLCLRYRGAKVRCSTSYSGDAFCLLGLSNVTNAHVESCELDNYSIKIYCEKPSFYQKCPPVVHGVNYPEWDDWANIVAPSCYSSPTTYWLYPELILDDPNNCSSVRGMPDQPPVCKTNKSVYLDCPYVNDCVYNGECYRKGSVINVYNPDTDVTTQAYCESYGAWCPDPNGNHLWNVKKGEDIFDPEIYPEIKGKWKCYYIEDTCYIGNADGTVINKDKYKGECQYPQYFKNWFTEFATAIYDAEGCQYTDLKPTETSCCMLTAYDNIYYYSNEKDKEKNKIIIY